MDRSNLRYDNFALFINLQSMIKYVSVFSIWKSAGIIILKDEVSILFFRMLLFPLPRKAFLYKSNLKKNLNENI